MDFERKQIELQHFERERLYLENEIRLHQNQLDEIQKKIKFLINLLHPNVSLSEIKLKGKDYIIIKGSYQIIDEKKNKNRMSVFVGRKDEFPKGKNDIKAKEIATEKILLLLQSKIAKK
jgi:hypothetical protein